MNRWIAGGVLGAALLALPTTAVDGQPAKPGKKANWLTSYEEGRAAAKQSGKPLFVVFRCQP